MEPINLAIDTLDLSCTQCGNRQSAGCRCWTKCECGWSFRTNAECRNPQCDNGSFVKYEGITHIKGLPGLTLCQVYPDTILAGMEKSTEKAFKSKKSCLECKNNMP